MKKQKMTISGEEGEFDYSLSYLFGLQHDFQKLVTGLDKIDDDVKWFQYHMTAIIEELGECLKSDKRWKTHRNARYNPSEKLKELADIFITVLNIVMYSGIDADHFSYAVISKIKENKIRFEKGRIDNDSNR